MKKFLSLLLAAMLLLGCLPAMADEPTWKVIKTTGVVKCSNSTKIEGQIEIPAESELEEDAVFTVKLLADGTMSCEFSMMGMPVIFYLDAVAAEVAPAA